MKKRLKEMKNAVEKRKPIRLQLHQAQGELEECRNRLEQVDEQLQVYKKAETLLQGQKQLTEMIARGDPLELILEDSCKLVEKALQGSLAIIMLLNGRRLGRGGAPHPPEYIAGVHGV